MYYYLIVLQQPSRYENYQFKSARALGIAQIVCGVLCFIFQIAAIAVGATAAFVAPGIWCGILVSSLHVHLSRYWSLPLHQQQNDVHVLEM